jgi:uncharacterized protein DUF6601
MERRTITVTEQVGMHLVRPSKGIYIKPLPQYLLNYEFWKQYLCKDPKQTTNLEKSLELYKCAVGFLLSYTWLIRHESDFALAKEYNLVPDSIEWRFWIHFVESFLSHINEKTDLINKRYHYGELRLPNLDNIFRYSSKTRRLRGYQPGYGQFSLSIKRNFEWMGLVFLYLVAILSAMQVGLATKDVMANQTFNWACYVFSIFCIVLAAFSVLIPFIRHTFLLLWFCFRWTEARQDMKKQQRAKEEAELPVHNRQV